MSKIKRTVREVTIMKEEIFKIQVPVAGEQKALIYNKDKSILFHLPIDEVEPVMGDELKAYFLGSIVDVGNNESKFEIKKKVRDQSW